MTVALPKSLADQLDLGLFDHLLERFKSPLLTPNQVAAATGWSRRTIYELCEEGLLETHTLPDRTHERKQITRRSVAALLARTANYEPRDFDTLLDLILPTLTAAQLARLVTQAQAHYARKPKTMTKPQ